MLNSFRVILGSLYVLLLAALVVIAVITYRNHGESDSRAEAVKGTLNTIEAASEIPSLYGELQLLSHANVAGVGGELPALYAKAKSNLRERLSTIRRSTSSNPGQAARLDSLETRIDELVASADASIAGTPQVTPDPLALQLLSRDTELRLELHEIVKSIRQADQQLLLIREADYAESLDRYHRAFNFLLAGVIVTLGASFFTVRHNFNKRLQIEAEQRRTHDLFFELFHDSPVAGLVCRCSDLTVMNCNQRYLQMFNRPEHEIVGKYPLFLDFVPDSYRQRLMAVALRHEKLFGMEVKIDAFGRDTMWLEISLQPTTIRNELCTRFTILDITPHKKAELDIKAALAAEVEVNKMKSDFITLASHEFRTPLTSIITSAALLKGIPTSENERLEKHASRIKTSVDTISSILDDFLSVSRIDEGKVQISRQRIDVAEFVQGVCDGLKPIAKHGQQIAYAHAGDQFVLLDEKLLGVILSNLLRNALKYSDDESIVKVSSHANHDFRLTVKDSGIGIPVDEQPRIFDRFFRGSNAVNIQGTGLGLYIVKLYAEKLNGIVEMNSAPGEGSEFHVTFKDAGWVPASRV